MGVGCVLHCLFTLCYVYLSLRIFDIIDENLEAKSTKQKTRLVQQQQTEQANTPRSAEKMHLTSTERVNLIICVSNISFRYSSRPDVPVLQDLSVDINPLEITCLVGKSGSGKSTLLAVLSGLLFPQQGSVSLNRKDRKRDGSEGQFSKGEKWLHHNVGVMQQHDKSLMSGTIRENIEYGKVTLQ